MPIYRIRGDILDSFKFYPVFERRVISFARRMDISTSENYVAAELRHRFINQPAASGYWLAATEQGEVVGHVCGWLTVNMGTLEIFLWQQEGKFTAEHKQLWMEDCSRWIDEIDGLRGRCNYIPPSIPVSGFSLVTAKDGEVYAEYIERMGFERPQIMAVLKFQRKQARLVQPATNLSLAVPKGLVN